MQVALRRRAAHNGLELSCRASRIRFRTNPFSAAGPVSCSELLGANKWQPIPWRNIGHELMELGKGDWPLTILLNPSGRRPWGLAGTVIYLFGRTIIVDEKDDEVIALTSHADGAALRRLHLDAGT